MTVSTLTLAFPAVQRREVTAVFDGGDVTSDSGVLLLRQADRALELTRALADAVCDLREAGKVEHPVWDVLRARIYGIAMGYEDCNDFDRLAGDPAFKTACDRLPTRDGDLASQPTLSRFENALSRADLFRMGVAVARAAAGRLPRSTKRIVIDVDPTDDPCHGQQEFEFFNGFYDCHCYLPLMVYLSGDDGRQWPAAALLRPGNAGATDGLFGVLRVLIREIRRRFPTAKIELRGDSSFGVNEVLRFCHQQGLDYTLGLKSNAVIARLSECVRAQVEEEYRRLREEEPTNPRAGDGLRLYQLLPYQAGSWERWERMILRAEMTEGTYNSRYIISNRSDLTAREAYAHYCARGDRENRIKEFKLDLLGGRTSCHRFLANQARVLLHLAAALLMKMIQHALEGTRWAAAQIATLRTRLLKVGARVVVTCRRIVFHLPTSFPQRESWRLLCQRLC
jgi:hypothetical protein